MYVLIRTIENYDWWRKEVIYASQDKENLDLLAKKLNDLYANCEESRIWYNVSFVKVLSTISDFGEVLKAAEEDVKDDND